MGWMQQWSAHFLGPTREVSAAGLTSSRRQDPQAARKKRRERSSKWPREVLTFVDKYVELHPCFYIEELQAELRAKFEQLSNISEATICRALRFDLDLTRKRPTKRAREAAPCERREYEARLMPFYSCPDQLVFVDETAKDDRSVLRKNAWSKRGTPAVVSLPSSRGERLSVLAAMDVSGFSSWGHTFGTFSRKEFHNVFATKIAPYLNPWPLPRSIVVMGNAKIHMYEELQELVHSTGALLFFLPPYSPDLNPIEVGFSLLKRWILKHACLAFKEAPVEVMRVALRECTKINDQVGYGLYRHCVYLDSSLNISS